MMYVHVHFLEETKSRPPVKPDPSRLKKLQCSKLSCYTYI